MFTLDKWQQNYAQDVAKYANNKNIADKLRNAFPHPYTLEDAKNFITDCINRDGKDCITRAITVDGIAVGSIGVFLKDDVYCKSAELGYWLAEDFWGKGIMTQAIKQICALAFEAFDIVRIFAEPFADNRASIAVLEKCGFSREGRLTKSVWKNNKFHDSFIYALIKE